MNEKQIAFIMCVNNDQECQEAIRYIEYLPVPEDFTKDIITICDAPSMAAGYQAAMEGSDAKYKVYMHQDVFIYYKSFVYNIIDIFKKNSDVGAIGMIGRKKLPDEFYIAADWDVGNIYFNGAISQIEKQNYSKWPMEVDIVDGLLIATQYDINWREDLFDKWDFYDISQCMEMKRSGYKVVVPYQEKPWCYHDNYYSRLKDYFFYQERFCNEYQDIVSYKMQVNENPQKEIDELVEQMLINLKNMVNQGTHQELWNVVEQMNGKIHFALRDIVLIAQIDHLERQNLNMSRFWDDEPFEVLLSKICDLKFKIKRMEFDIDKFSEGMIAIDKSFTIFAIAATVLQFASDRNLCIRNIGEWYIKNYGIEMGNIWKNLTMQH